MVSLAVNAEPVSTFEREKVILVELIIADLTKFTCALCNRRSLTINKVFIEFSDEGIIFLLLFFQIVTNFELYFSKILRFDELLYLG